MLNLGESIHEMLLDRGVSRRDFMKFCGLMANALALPKNSADMIARALEQPRLFAGR